MSGSLEITPRAPWAFLLGRPPMQEYIGFLTEASSGREVNIPEAAKRWRHAATVLDGLAVTEAGIADGQKVADLPTEIQSKAAKYLADPVVAASYAFVPVTVGLVHLENVVVFQKQINLEYARQLQSLIGDWDVTDERLLDFCLAIDQPVPPINRVQTSGNTFVFQSASTDARLLDAKLIDATQLEGVTTSGRAHAAVLLLIGYGMNALSVLSADGRLILANGSHRAYALMAAGVTHVPAVVQHIAREDDLEVAPQVKQNPALYLKHPRPSLLRDYFAEGLHDVVDRIRRARQLRLQFGYESVDVPG